MNIELDTEQHSDLFIQIADTVRESFNMIQIALGSPLRLEKPGIEEDEEEEKKDDTCEDCGGEGWIEEIDYLRVNSATIDIPYKKVMCQKCGGNGTIEED